MPKPGADPSSGISLGDVLRLPKWHPAYRRRSTGTIRSLLARMRRLCGARGGRGMGEAVAGRFYVRRRTRPDGSFDFWCVNRLFTLRARPSQERGRRRLPACLRDGPRGDCVGGLARATLRPLDRLAHVQEPESACREAGGRGRMGYREMAMTDRDLAQAERLIAECKNRIASQREVIANAFQKGHETDVAVSLLRAFESNLQAFEKHRQLIRAWQNRSERR
jgi:hypothetical protein